MIGSCSRANAVRALNFGTVSAFGGWSNAGYGRCRRPILNGPTPMNIEHKSFKRSDWVPNNTRLPVLIYRQAIFDATSSDFEEAFEENGWTGIWRDGVFDYHHYHSGAHEALGVGRGTANLQLGGPGGEIIELATGDCLLLPAGTGHKKIEASSDFEIVGAYPPRQQADIQTQAPSAELLAIISSLSIPGNDPVVGATGGLKEFWR